MGSLKSCNLLGCVQIPVVSVAVRSSSVTRLITAVQLTKIGIGDDVTYS